MADERGPLNRYLPEKRLIEVDILRGVAMLAVVAIHVSNIPLANLAASRWYLPVYLFHNALNFAVPAFMFISALLAAYSAGGRPISLGSYYKSKLIRVVLPYLLWSLLYILMNLAVRSLNPADLLSLKNWMKWILQGRAYTHLYYLAVMIQFYILFPLLIKLARLVKDMPLFALIIAVAGYNIVYWLNKLWLYAAFPYFQSSFFWYFSIIFAGLWFGLNYTKACDWMKKHIAWVIAVCLISVVVYLYLNFLLYKHVQFHSYFYYTIGPVFFVSLPLCLLMWARRFRERQGLAGRGLLWVGRYTMGIYLAHPVLNYFLRKITTTKNIVLLFLICAAAVFVYTVVCGYMTKLLEKSRLTAWIVGAKK